MYKNLLVAALLLSSASIATAATTLMQIGRSPFHIPALTSPADLREMVAENEVAVRKGFEIAGNPELAEAFIAQMPTAEIEQVDFYKGDSFVWMFFRKNGKGNVRIARDVTWGADNPFPGFKVAIDQDGMRYNYCVPLGCGNIALIGATPIPAPVVVPEPEPEPVAEVPPAPVEPEISPYRFIADLGYYAQFDPAHYVFGRVGGEYIINEDFSVLGLVGVAPKVTGSDGATAFTADLLGEYKFGEGAFINLGLGAWITDGDDDVEFPEAEDSQIDIIAAMGARVYGEPDEFNASLFLEVRSAPDEIDEIKDYGRFGAGVRFRF